ncbi:very short patch repair endonuclease [Mycobacterium sp. SM1]|nr:very short patch repair endonuclease [Mycobacterium sp. SM1]
MQGNRSRDTKPELLLRSELHSRGLRYRVAARPLPTLRWTADVVFTRAKVAVFIDGCFWHRCPHHYRQPSSNVNYWIAKVNRNVERDQRVDSLLHDAGWTVVRVWEHDDPLAVADFVERLVGRRQSPGAGDPGAADHNQITSGHRIKV